MRQAILFLLGLVCAPVPLCAQVPFYDLGSVREIRLYFSEPDWRARLDSLYLLGDNQRLIGDVRIDGTLLPGVGVRFKGYSSYSAGRVKNPFNIDLNTVDPEQHYQGYKKVKLSNVTSDPSFLRETLAYAIAREYMPASAANYANVYVNDTLLGLYTNVEDVSKEFLRTHFGSSDQAFVKGNPTTVSLTGDNANLSDAPGVDSAAYADLYSMESEHGWGELLQLINVLNNGSDTVATVLNVDRALWMHAFNYAVINFDSYVGYAQNYYLYRDDNGAWNPILWDLNMAFASFRLSDASLYWNGFNIAQAITMDPLMHFNSVSVSPRPLMRNLFQRPMYRRMYLAHLRTIIQEQIVEQRYSTLANELLDLITPHVQADTNKFFSDADLLNNLHQTVSGVTDYPGITQLMDQRAAFLATYPGFSGQPVLGDPTFAPAAISVGNEVTITALITNADTAFIAYRSAPYAAFRYMAMVDDGAHGDGAANDDVYGVRFVAESDLVQYYLYAENATAGSFSPARAAHEFHSIQTRMAPGDVVINEFMAVNGGVVRNEVGEAADWIELHNRSGRTLSTVGLHLSDDPHDPTRWALPVRTLEPGAYLVIWADDHGSLSELHADFRLEANAGTITLAYDDTTVIDQVNYSVQYPIYSTGRYPNGTGAFRELPPSFNTMNRMEATMEMDRYLMVYPNPATTELYVIVHEDAPFEVQVIRSDGRIITPAVERTTRELIRIDTRTLAAGHYVVQVRTNEKIAHQPFVLIQ